MNAPNTSCALCRGNCSENGAQQSEFQVCLCTYNYTDALIANELGQPLRDPLVVRDPQTSGYIDDAITSKSFPDRLHIPGSTWYSSNRDEIDLLLSNRPHPLPVPPQQPKSELPVRKSPPAAVVQPSSQCFPIALTPMVDPPNTSNKQNTTPYQASMVDLPPGTTQPLQVTKDDNVVSAGVSRQAGAHKNARKRARSVQTGLQHEEHVVPIEERVVVPHTQEANNEMECTIQGEGEWTTQQGNGSESVVTDEVRFRELLFDVELPQLQEFTPSDEYEKKMDKLEAGTLNETELQEQHAMDVKVFVQKPCRELKKKLLARLNNLCKQFKLSQRRKHRFYGIITTWVHKKVGRKAEENVALWVRKMIVAGYRCQMRKSCRGRATLEA